jgi:hypothetical protein
VPKHENSGRIENLGVTEPVFHRNGGIRRGAAAGVELNFPLGSDLIPKNYCLRQSLPKSPADFADYSLCRNPMRQAQLKRNSQGGKQSGKCLKAAGLYFFLGARIGIRRILTLVASSIKGAVSLPSAPHQLQ